MPTPKESKLTRVLRSLSTVDLNRLEKFVGSPYFNVDERLVRLIKYHKKLFNDGVQQVDDKILWTHLFPSIEYDGKSIRILKSKLLSLVQEFLSVESFISHPSKSTIHLLLAVEQSQIEPLRTSALRTSERVFDRIDVFSSDYFYDLFQYEKLSYSLTKSELSRISKGGKSSVAFESINSTLDQHYFTEKLRLYASLLTWKKFIVTETSFPLLDEIMNLVENGETHLNDLGRIYYLIIKTFDDSSELKHYLELKKLAKSTLHTISKTEGREILEAIINYLLIRVNEGNAKFLNELFKSYLLGLETELLLLKDSLSPWTFRNLVGVGLRLKEFDWVGGFISQYESYLPFEFRKSIVGLSKAQYFFYLKEYDKVLEHLQNVEFNELNTNINAKITLLATYYELDEYDLLQSSVIALRKLIRRKRQVSLERKNLYFNFLKFIETLSKGPHSKKELAALRSIIEKSEGLPSKTWLLEKVDELLPQHLQD